MIQLVNMYGKTFIVNQKICIIQRIGRNRKKKVNESHEV
jgi:hypothetical protein